ncbi:hypothetical protein VTO42DRAFT_7297 [Malbranchea cinnamomea]
MAPAKQKAQKMSIGTFLADETLGSWADEMDDMPLPSTSAGYGTSRGYSSTTTGYTTTEHTEHRGYSVREELPLPTHPPYTAHIGNLSFDATQNDISELFAGCEVTSVRIVEDKLTRQPKGFGYVEFANVDGLKKALTFQGASLKGRSIRVSVAEPPKERHETRDLSDWTRKGPLPDLPSQRRGPRGFDNASDFGSERGGRRPYEPADGKVRDLNNWERKGPLSPTLAPAGLAREGRPRSNEGPQFRRTSPSWGEGRSQDGSRPPRRDFRDRERAPTAPELDNQWRARMRPDVPPPQPAPTPAPAVRPKLNLQKRTVQEEVAAPSTTTTDAKSSPFGAARPIDTAAREREIEERRLARQREAEEKAKAEKAEKQRIAKEQELAKQQEREQAASTAQQPAPTPSTANKDESDVPQGGKNFEILQRVGESGELVQSEEATDTAKTEEPANVTPKEPAKDPQAHPSKTNGSWRNGNGPRARGPSYRGGHRNSQAGLQKNQAPPAPAEQEEEGWSTVGPKQRYSRRGNRHY